MRKKLIRTQLCHMIIMIIKSNLLEFIQIINIKIYSLVNYNLITKITKNNSFQLSILKSYDISSKNIPTVRKNSNFQFKSDVPIFMEINAHFSPHFKLFRL